MKRWAIVLALCLPCSAQLWSNQLATTRAANWTNAGIVGGGGIPSGTWTQCGATIAAYGTSGTPASPATIINAMNHTGTGYTGCSANTFVLLGAGTFWLNANIRNKGVSNTVLRGMGASQTQINVRTSTTCAGGITTCSASFEDNGGEFPGGIGTASVITSGLTQGSSAIVVTNPGQLSIVLNQTTLVIDGADTGFSGNSVAAGGTGTVGFAFDNGGFFQCGAGYAPAGSGTMNTSTSGTGTGTNFTSAWNGAQITVGGIQYTMSGIPTGTGQTTMTLTPAPPNATGVSYTVSPQGCSYDNPDAGGARVNRFQQEYVIVTGCTPNCTTSGSATLNIFPPVIHPNWPVINNPELWPIHSETCNTVGFENFSIDSAGTSGSFGINIADCINWWVKGVRESNSFAAGITDFLSSFGDVESNYCYNAGQSVSGTDPQSHDPSCYLDNGGGNNIWVNNIAQWTRLGLINGGPGAGKVFAYNFLVNCFESNTDLWQCLWDGHSNGDDYNLYEGNVTPQDYNDQTHGGKLATTHFRNLIFGWESCSNGNCAIGASQKGANLYCYAPLSNNRYENFIGNVCGTPTIYTGGYVFTNAEWFVAGTTGQVWNIGSGNSAASPPGSPGGPIPIDSITLSSTMWFDNWDYFNNATMVCTAAATPNANCTQDQRAGSAPTYPGLASPSTTLPASFFLSARPAWYSSSIPFPANGPDVTSGTLGYCNGTVNTAGQYALVAAISTANCAGQGMTTSGWGGHANAIPAMLCFLQTMSPSVPDGTGTISTFDAGAAGCNYYAATPPTTPAAPSRNMLLSSNGESREDAGNK